MTRDNEDRRNDEGEPGHELEPTDVIKCRECGGLVRRVNAEHLNSDRCFYTNSRHDVYSADGAREDIERPNHPTTVEEYKEMYPDAPVMSPKEKNDMSVRFRDEEASQRRRELMSRRWNGEPMSDVKASLSNKFDVKEGTIEKDWTRRGEWIGRVFGLEDADAVVLESLAQKQDVRKRLLQLARRAQDQNEISEAVRALKAVDDNIDETIDHQQSLGNVAQAESKHSVKVEGDVSHEHTHEAPGEGLDEETLSQLDDITGGEGVEATTVEYKEVDDEGDDG